MRPWWTACTFALQSQISQTGWQHMKSSRAKAGDKSKVSVWLTAQHIFDALDRLSNNMQRSTLMLAIPSLKLFAYCESWSILAGNSERPKVHTFFMRFIFPAAAQCLNKTNYSPSEWTFFPLPFFMESKQAPGLLFTLQKRQIITFSSAHTDETPRSSDYFNGIKFQIWIYGWVQMLGASCQWRVGLKSIDARKHVLSLGPFH